MPSKKPPSLPGLQTFIKDHPIESFAVVLEAAKPRPTIADSREAKKNYAQRLSEGMAVLVANKLRDFFTGVLPNSDGTGGESRARTGKGVKKLDVNYSTPELGLGLGVSIKTLNFPDPRTKRYTKNPTRLDNELRAEAMDYHERQPFAVLVTLVLVPRDACDDGDRKRPKSSWSSFAQIVNVLRHRTGREKSRDELQLFERGFVGLYEPAKAELQFFDISLDPPQFGPPPATLTFDDVLKRVVEVYDNRNSVKPAWAKSSTVKPLRELEEDGLIASTDDEDDDEM